jgi:hypothetical protein
MAKKPAKKKAIKLKKKATKKTVKKTPKRARVDNAIRDSNGDVIGAKVLNHDEPAVEATEKPSKSPKGTEIDSSKGAVSIRAKKTSAEAAGSKKGYSVVMRGGVPTKVEDNGDEI